MISNLLFYEIMLILFNIINLLCLFFLLFFFSFLFFLNLKKNKWINKNKIWIRILCNIYYLHYVAIIENHLLSPSKNSAWTLTYRGKLTFLIDYCNYNCKCFFFFFIFGARCTKDLHFFFKIRNNIYNLPVCYGAFVKAEGTGFGSLVC